MKRAVGVAVIGGGLLAVMSVRTDLPPESLRDYIDESSRFLELGGLEVHRTLRVYPDLGHLQMEEDPERTVRDALELLAEAQAA